MESSAPPRTPRRRRRIGILLLVLLAAPATWLARAAGRELDYFRLRTVRVQGTHYLAPEAVVRALRVDTLDSVWDDLEVLTRRVAELPQVRSASIDRRLPGTLVVTVEENLPVALVQGPGAMQAVDSSGRVLPIDPSVTAISLPVLFRRDPVVFNLLADVRARDAAVFARISDVVREDRTSVTLRVVSTASAPDLLRVRVPMGLSPLRLADIFPVENDLLRRRLRAAELDLRYRDQVIARLK